MHRRKRPQSPETEPDLPITPFLDMAFQLMFYFILVFNPKPLEGQLSLILPDAGIGTPSAVTLNDEKPDSYIVTVAPTGGIPSDITLLKDGDTESRTFKMTPARQTAAMDDLYKALDEIVKAKKAAKGLIPKLEIRFADDVRYQFVIKMLDDAKVAGFEKISPNSLDKTPKKAP